MLPSINTQTTCHDTSSLEFNKFDPCMHTRSWGSWDAALLEYVQVTAARLITELKLTFQELFCTMNWGGMHYLSEEKYIN